LGQPQECPIEGVAARTKAWSFWRRLYFSIVLLAVIVLNEKLPGGDTIAMTLVCTILLSVILHGLSANPLIAALEARL
jgi:hypothetical protein